MRQQHPCLLNLPKWGGSKMATSSLHSLGFLTFEQ